jgi:hypothetical protein
MSGRQFVTVGSLVLAFSLFCVFTESAAAQAFRFGQTVFGKPSCVSTEFLQSEEVICVFRGPNNELYSIQLDPRTGASRGRNLLGTSIGGNPSCGAGVAIMCAVRGLDNKLYAIIFDPVTMASTGLQRASLGLRDDSLAGDPSCALLSGLTAPPLHAWCGMRGPDNHVYVAFLQGTSHGFEFVYLTRTVLDQDQIIVGDPSCALSSGGPMICVARAPDSTLAVIEPFGPWRQYLRLNGPPPLGFMVGDPSCASTSVQLGGDFVRSPYVTCGVRGTDNALSVISFGMRFYQITTPAGEPTAGYDVPGYLRIGGQLTGNPSCASTPSEIVTCGVRGTDGALHLIDIHTLTGETMASYDRLTGVAGGLLATDPTCAAFGDTADRYVACAILDLNNILNTVASARTAAF